MMVLALLLGQTAASSLGGLAMIRLDRFVLLHQRGLV